jgi:hypothetical protein
MDDAHRHCQQFCGSLQFKTFLKNYHAGNVLDPVPNQCLGIYNQLTLISAYSNKMRQLRLAAERAVNEAKANEMPPRQWYQCPGIMLNLFFIFEGIEVAVEPEPDMPANRSTKSRGIPTSQNLRAVKICPNYKKTDWRSTDEQIREARLLYIDFDSLDVAASFMRLEPQWKKNVYDPTGVYEHWREFFVAISR